MVLLNEIRDSGFNICTQEPKFGEIAIHDGIEYRDKNITIVYSCHVRYDRKNYPYVKHDKGAYFKVINSDRLKYATKIIRISLTEPKIIHNNYRRWEELKLTDDIIDNIINIMDKPSQYNSNLSVYESLVNQYNNDARIEHLKVQNINPKYKPDYTKLKEEI